MLHMSYMLYIHYSYKIIRSSYFMMYCVEKKFEKLTFNNIQNVIPILNFPYVFLYNFMYLLAIIYNLYRYN